MAKMKNLYITCGIPGVGKSTWLRKNVADQGYIVSRDEIRFSKVKEDEEYFSHEKEVFKTFVDNIQWAIDNPEVCENVYADATHINKASRDKLFNALNLDNVKNVIVLVFKPKLEVVLERNEKRRGTRAYVPRGVVRRMFWQFERPENDWPRIFDTKYIEV